MSERSVFSPRQVDAVHELLRQAFRRAGHGSIQRVEDALGLYRNYYGHHRRRRKLDLGLLFSTLAELDVDPGEFLAEALGFERAPKADDDRDPGLPAPAVRAAPRQAAGPTSAVSPARHEELVEWLRRMDELRYDDPEAAIRQLRGRAKEIPETLAARYLAVCGSSHRLVGAHRDAMICLRGAERRILPGQEALLAEILQRRSLAICDTGDYHGALGVSERATGIYTRIRNALGVGKSLVDQGKFLLYLERLDETVAGLSVAVELLPESETRYHFTIHQILSSVYRKKRNPDLALQQLGEARGLVPDKLALGRLLWSESAVYRDLSRLDDASKALATAIDILTPICPLDGLLATAEQIRIFAVQNRPAEALQAARSAADLMGAVQGNRVAESAIAEIYGHCTSDRLKLEAIDRVIVKLKSTARASTSADTLRDRLLRAYARLGVQRNAVARQAGLPHAAVKAIEEERPVAKNHLQSLQAWLDRGAEEIVLAME